MRRTIIGAGAVLAAALAGCDGGTEANVQVPGPEGAENRLEALPEGARNGVFIRAIRDAGRECQHVESSERAGEHQGFPVWQARCSDGGTWTIVVMNDGTAAVINADEVQLVNQAAAQNAQGQ